MNLTEGFTSEEKGYGADEIDYRVVDASEILSCFSWPLVNVLTT